MTKFAKVSAVFSITVLVVAGAAAANPIDFTDRAAWEAAVGEAPTLTDDYNDVTSDQSAGGGAIVRAGYLLSNINRLDVLPFLQVGGAGLTCNGTPVVCDSDNMVVTFDSLTQSFGADWACGNGSYSWTINYVTDQGDSGSFQLPSTSNTGEFRGFIVAAAFNTVTFSSSGCWAAIDDLAAHPDVTFVAEDDSSWDGVKTLFR